MAHAWLIFGCRWRLAATTSLSFLARSRLRLRQQSGSKTEVVVGAVGYGISIHFLLHHGIQRQGNLSMISTSAAAEQQEVARGPRIERITCKAFYQWNPTFASLTSRIIVAWRSGTRTRRRHLNQHSRSVVSISSFSTVFLSKSDNSESGGHDAPSLVDRLCDRVLRLRDNRPAGLQQRRRALFTDL